MGIRFTDNLVPEKKKTPPKQERIKTPPKQKAPVRGAPEPVPVTPPPIQEKVEAPVQARKFATHVRFLFASWKKVLCKKFYVIHSTYITQLAKQHSLHSSIT
jgi:hypothetical protein